MDGDDETIRALVKGETGSGCKTAVTLLSAENDVVPPALFVLGNTLVLFVGTGEDGKEEFVFLMLVKNVGEAVEALLILEDGLEELGW